jgi:hypothetical protein
VTHAWIDRQGGGAGHAVGKVVATAELVLVARRGEVTAVVELTVVRQDGLCGRHRHLDAPYRGGLRVAGIEAGSADHQAARLSVDLPLTRQMDEAATKIANEISPANRMKKSGPSASPAAAKLAPTM